MLTANSERATSPERRATASIAEVIFNLPLDRGFDYTIPPALAQGLAPGCRVLVPFGPRRLIGYVRSLRDTTDIERPKAILKRIDDQPALPQDLLDLAAWMASYYGCSIGEACATILPTAFRRRPITGGETGAAATEPVPTLTSQQQHAWERLESALTEGRHEVMLLHGVTGSGKTELYLQAIALALTQGRCAICLVPEIALTPQATDRFRARFGDDVVLWHSRLSTGQRAEAWERLATGRSHVMIGTRSAVFAPLPRLGVVILDEEHETSYKQDQTPRYHARDVAIERSRQHQAVALLGSATPSMESYYRTTQGAYTLLELTERVRGRPMPAIEVIDLRNEFVRGRKVPLSAPLEVALRRVTERREQAILLLNRRGFARVVTCQHCGLVFKCAQCAVPMVYHARPPKLICHYCDAQETPPDICPGCQKPSLRYRGAGTERIESELHRVFPGSEIGRMDTDTTRTRESHRQLYDALRGQQIQLLVGTQMVAKGLDIPQVTLVGVISADTALNLPDFRAGERTFDLLTQVAGRAGRGEQPGRVLIQTYCPEHYAIRAAAAHDYRQFYEAEMAMRKRLMLPPYVHLIELTVQGTSSEEVGKATRTLAHALMTAMRSQRAVLLGPAPHRVETIRRVARWRLLLKVGRVEPAMDVIRQTLGSSRRFDGHAVVVDVDPL